MTAEETKTAENGAQSAPLPLEGVDISPKQDEGVLKVIKREGTGTEMPMIGDRVSVHYTGWLLDGTKFDSSLDRKDKFSFDLGKGEVIKAWDIAVATMKVGEVCHITCKPEYAYGSAGSPPKIPPNATLVFEVELFEFKGEDLTEEEDGGIIRRIQTRGEGYARPNDGAIVEVALEGYYKDQIFDRREIRFEVGEGETMDLPCGLEKAIQRMEKGEHSIVYLKPSYAFGSAGKEKFHIPPNAELKYEVHLKSFEKAKESWEMSSEEKLEQSTIVKERGTVYFKEGKYKQALVQYKKIVSWLEYESSFSNEDAQKAQALRLASHLNLAMCYLKLQSFSAAIENCNKALELDSNNEKGLFRRGEAHLAVNDFDLARADFQKVLQLYPSNKAAKAQLALCQQRIRKQLAREKKLYANMFERLAEEESKLNELVVGDTSGKLLVYKNDDSRPWLTCSCQGMLTCVGVGDVCNKGKNLVVAVSAEGWFHLCDLTPAKALDASGHHETLVGEEQRPVFKQHIPANTKVMLISDIDGDGRCELVLGYTDRVVRAFRWEDLGDGTEHLMGQLVSLKKWMLEGQGNGHEEVVACAWDGQTYIIDHNRTVVRFQVDENIRAFCTGLYACKGGHNSPCLVYVTFNQKIYVYWEVQLERMESTNLLKLLEAEPEYRDLLQELGVGESLDARGRAQLPRPQQAHQPLFCPQILTTSQPPAPCFTTASTIRTRRRAVLPRASKVPPSWTGPVG